MMQSSLDPGSLPPGHGLHVAIVMDGNGRWAEQQGLPRSAGHRAGAAALRRTVRGAATLGIDTLTVYAFSSDNWRRPPAETRHLMSLFRRFLRSEAAPCAEEGIRLSVLGRRDRLAPGLRVAIDEAERRTRGGDRLQLQVAIDYSARDAILEAARLLAASTSSPGTAPSRAAFGDLLARVLHAPAPLRDVDLLIRTGGEQRLSDFLLWECAYAELLFTPCLWPDFAEDDLGRALDAFRLRERRFGGLTPPRALEALAHVG
jgi:undecaprenyl diphosphate synthase